jgi:hypothetical protein
MINTIIIHYNYNNSSIDEQTNHQNHHQPFIMTAMILESMNNANSIINF